MKNAKRYAITWRIFCIKKFNLGGIKMKFEVLEIVNKNNEKAKKEKEDKKLRNRIKRLFNKKQPKRLIFNPNWK